MDDAYKIVFFFLLRIQMNELYVNFAPPPPRTTNYFLIGSLKAFNMIFESRKGYDVNRRQPFSFYYLIDRNG